MPGSFGTQDSALPARSEEDKKVVSRMKASLETFLHISKFL